LAGNAFRVRSISSHSSLETRGSDANRWQQSAHLLRQGPSPCAEAQSSLILDLDEFQN